MKPEIRVILCAKSVCLNTFDFFVLETIVSYIFGRAVVPLLCMEVLLLPVLHAKGQNLLCIICSFVYFVLFWL